MAINNVHTSNNTQDDRLSETSDLWSPISDEQQAAISGGYQLQNEPRSSRYQLHLSGTKDNLVTAIYQPKKCIPGVTC